MSVEPAALALLGLAAPLLGLLLRLLVALVVVVSLALLLLLPPNQLLQVLCWAPPLLALLLLHQWPPPLLLLLAPLPACTTSHSSQRQQRETWDVGKEQTRLLQTEGNAVVRPSCQSGQRSCSLHHPPGSWSLVCTNSALLLLTGSTKGEISCGVGEAHSQTEAQPQTRGQQSICWPQSAHVMHTRAPSLSSGGTKPPASLTL
jgi:hypothetical protein